ncbi:MULTISPECIES: GGDEF domain-containing protein [unclassified Acinetobacter]|uniref:GGDEF domain-containing protein n=1 Tax=unclassified Acinetobacter TaxID=196816 RepID=UPI0024486E83|nr:MULTISPECIES: GGDEF domain-containing protein [unclassified Acinetobacter]MDH0029945.1 GGDEF domain-containing protein [Acinetobacter sp. GD04021]MDH0885291.1 GGDEF domain-containing protein [Acinetobacter sp. GD03873]MDH1081408.1 GGDEF domain-containing protein [Acinetobacter sp. GD03983]MDH2188810.1 GGDEF domain-containing protein [Acinetobacter sp. GD03645]MDH2203533.1 GGDEF domain-containing protein [Acinetobacter sp. GD03647]
MERKLKNEKLRSEQISLRLFACMVVIILSILYISIPLIIHSDQEYIKTQQVLTEMTSLRALVKTANKISRERAPSNKLMSSQPDELENNRKELQAFRQVVDAQINETILTLQKNGFDSIALQLRADLKPKLAQGRKKVDAYAEIPADQRTSAQLDHAIVSMFKIWDSNRKLLNVLMTQSKTKDSKMSNYFISILVLTDMRDQAGRVASNIMAPVTFGEKISDENRARSLQTQHQAQYFWTMVDAIQPQNAKTSEYQYLYRRVKTEFLDQGLPLIVKLLDESKNNEAYFLTGTQLTERIVDKFITVMDLQNYILDYSIEVATEQHKSARHQLIFTLCISSLCLLIAIFTMIYARQRVFSPLIRARDMILGLSNTPDEQQPSKPQQEFVSLFEAIGKLKDMLQQRDMMELQLKQIANSDVLTGVSNRLALDEYIGILESQPESLAQTCVIVVDIDNFKFVNDQYGHIVGDQVIVMIADQLKQHVRSSDLIVRYGGDEFLVVIENIQMDVAKAIAESIRLGISKERIVISNMDEAIQVSVSIGVAIGAGSWLELLEKADQSMLRAKAKGKNVVEG